MEIERKYLLPPPTFSLGEYPSVRIEQSYISTDPVIRLRRAGDDYILTVKGPGAIIHAEFELPLSLEQYTRLLDKTIGRVIKKTRHFIPLPGGHTAEADVYHDYLEGLMTVEVEFDSEDAMSAFKPPEWFGRDVSDEKEYKNASLAVS